MLFNNRLDRKGIIVSDTNKEARTQVITPIGKAADKLTSAQEEKMA